MSVVSLCSREKCVSVVMCSVVPLFMCVYVLVSVNREQLFVSVSVSNVFFLT